ncbi:MAG: SUF system NifU family Fe-S cluster assembly protein [bacterium]|nr:SUF system NifU family Fe-S cluster assembly protein [bacterium]
MTLVNELYQDIILEHARRPRNPSALVGPEVVSTHEHNTLCGDDVQLFIETQGAGQDARIKRVAAVAKGCTLSIASGSLLTESLQGKTIAEALLLVEQIQAAATGAGSVLTNELQALGSIAHYPTRVKCVTMVWHAAKKLLMQPDSKSNRV